MGERLIQTEAVSEQLPSVEIERFTFACRTLNLVI